MSFAAVPYGRDCGARCARVIQATGTITRETPDAFLEFARQASDQPGLMNVLLIHSTGGSVDAALRFGRILRRLNTVVIVARSARAAGAGTSRWRSKSAFVSATCASACVYTLAGGAKRVVPPESRVAVHRMAGKVADFDWSSWRYGERQIFAGESEIRSLTAYIRQMGVDPGLVALAESVPHEHARVLSPKEIARLGLAQPKL